MNRIIPPFLAAVLALTLAGCSQSTDPTAPPPTIEHVHGIAQDPRGADLLVATHNGVFTISPSGKVAGPVGGYDFDAMGFTVTDDIFFASGHPGPSSTPAELGSPNLGIIRSDDYGATWSPIALTGSTDFHVLTAGPDGMLYGIPSGAPGLLLSADNGREWTDGAALSAADLVATDAGLYAATENGLMLSTDQGATFAPFPNAPALYALDARTDGTLAGVDTDGNLWTQDTSGTWERGERVEGTVQAFSLVSDDRVVLVDDRGVVEITPDRTKILSPSR